MRTTELAVLSVAACFSPGSPLGRDHQPVRATLPFDLTVTDPNGVYVFAMPWPVAAKTGKWRVTVKDGLSGVSDSATWEAR